MKSQAGTMRRVFLTTTLLVTALTVPAGSAWAQQKRGLEALGFHETMGLSEGAKLSYSCRYMGSTPACNIFYPGDQAEFAFELTNNSDKPLRGPAKVEVIPYGTDRTTEENHQRVFHNGAVSATPISVDIAPGKTQSITVKPNVPDRLGGYGLVVDLGAEGRTFVTTFVRTFKPDATPVHYPQIVVDMNVDVNVIARLGVCPNRIGFAYRPTTNPKSSTFFEQKWAALEEFKKAGLPVSVEFAIGNDPQVQPLGRARPWLKDGNILPPTKGVGDQAWLPSYDPDFKKLVKMVLEKYGWPRGTVIAVKFQNEPWDGKSISGWGADVPRYREIYTAMAEATEEARKEYGVEVMVGGCDSSSSAFDKLFADGKNTFLKDFDYCSIHYQNLDIPSTYKPFVERTGPYGRVQTWETEGSSAEDKMSAKIAACLAAGYDHICSVWYTEDISPAGKKAQKEGNQGVNIWSPAATVGAVVHFIGQRKFDQLLFQNGLPWVIIFHGNVDAQGKSDAEDGTVVVVGDLGAEFGHDALPFRNARGEKAVAEMAKLKSQLAALPPEGKKTGGALQRAIKFGGTLSDASLTLANPDGRFHLYDIYGNEMASKNGKLIVPLDQHGFFLRGDGKSGSFAALLEAIRQSRVEGIEPLAKKCHDMTSPVDKPDSTLRLELTNVLNRPLKGALAIQMEGLKVEPALQSVSFGPDETKTFTIQVSGAARQDNTYHLKMQFDAGADGKSLHEEDLHVNQIARRTIKVDGNLDDWKGILPQVITADTASGPTLAEKAWRPWENFDEEAATGLALGYLAYDENYLYFASKIADSHPDGGMARIETRDEDVFFYPAVCYELVGDSIVCQEREYKSPNPKAPLAPGGKSDARVNADWISPSSVMAVDLDLSSDKASRVALYFLLSGQKEAELSVTVTDRASKKTLDTRQVQALADGAYAVYDMSGKVRVTIAGKAGRKDKPCLSAMFFDSLPASAGPSVTKGAWAQFEKLDTSTSGNWKGVYGSAGYKMPTGKASLPAGVAVNFVKEAQTRELRWPEGVRRFTYAGSQPWPYNMNSVQIAFNVIDPAKKDWLVCPPGTMPGFTGYKDTDYEYALYDVAQKYGGGTEIWRYAVPGMPHKSFTPRSGKSPFDGPVKNGKLVVIQGDTTRLVECAIPWTEIPDVKKKCDAGETIKFSFRVNYGKSKSCMELARDRSVSMRNDFFVFCPDGKEHWANEVEFAFEK